MSVFIGPDFFQQVMPLFFIFLGIPILLLITVAVYQRVRNQPQDAIDDEFDDAVQPTFADLTATSVAEPDEPIEPSDFVEEITMSDKNPADFENEKPASRSKIDTGDLPPLDMLLGDVADEPESTPDPIPAPDEPPKVVQLRSMSRDEQYVQLNTGKIAPAQEVITILRDKDDGRLIIQVGDTAYRTLADSESVKQTFTQVMKELASVITKPDANPPTRKRYVVGQPEAVAKSAPPAAPSIRDLLDETPSTPKKPEPKPTPKVKSVPPPPISDGSMPGDLPSFKLEDNPLKVEKKGRFGGQKIESEPLPQLDIAAAIETYLQYKLQHTPEYAGRQIHIHGTPLGAIRIQVDQNYYDFVDEVADTEVRSFLQATIAEWQERQ